MKEPTPTLSLRREGTTLVVPSGFTMTINEDRSDRIRVEGTLTSSTGQLSLVDGGVEVAPGGNARERFGGV